MRVRKRPPEMAVDVLIHLFLAALCLTVLYPLYYMLIVSLSDGLSVMRGQVTWLPLNPNLETYKVVLRDPSILRSYVNSLVYTVLGTSVAVALTALCAYPLSRQGFYGRPLYTRLIIFTMFFEGGIIPGYMVINGLGLIDTLWAIVLPPAVNAWYMIVMRTFFQQIPNELHESAHMDGAHDFAVFARIVLPISTPVVATMVLFYAVWHWNSFFPALLYLNRKASYPMQLIMRNIVVTGEMAQQSELMTGESTVLITGLNIKYAVIYVTMAPILAVYPFVQKYFVKGMLVGSLKG
jgi:putative aldouronate transport system permease protein